MDGPADGSGRAAADRDALPGVLGSERCRHALSCVWDHGTELALADVAEEVAVREEGARISDIPPEEVKEVYMALYHDHLPELVDRGLVEYEQQRDLVRPARYAGRIVRRLDALGELPAPSAGRPTG